MVTIGVDAHKRVHHAVALDPLGRLLGSWRGYWAAGATAQKLLGQVLYPRFTRALFGMDPVAERLEDEAVDPNLDLDPIRLAVADVLASLQRE